MLARLDALLGGAGAMLSAGRRPAVERWRADAQALRFHLQELGHARPGGKGAGSTLVAVLGGTGTGKSTLVNRLMGRAVSAASFRRTFTSGPVAIVPEGAALAANWLGIEHVAVESGDLPARGRPGALLIVKPPAGQTAGHLSLPILIDTPDLDGDHPAHHAQADRVFRWAKAVLFLVTPEKYQMTELLPYYRLARRYAIPSLFVMNKCEEQAVIEDFRGQLAATLRASEDDADPRGGGAANDPSSGDSPAAPAPPTQRLFSLARDGAGYEPPAEMNLDALRQALAEVAPPPASIVRAGLANRCGDLLGRLTDQVVAPLREDRRQADALIAALREMEAPSIGVDVNPLTRQLHRRLQQRSILYLMGPGRVMDRVRQAPMLLARLPRFAWDYLRSGQVSAEMLNPASGTGAQTVPDFRAALADQFAVLQSRIDDTLRASPAGESWLTGTATAPGTSADEKPYAAARIDPAEAGKIADEELAELNAWLERKWNATPRDTRMLESFLRFLPGGRSLGRWSEAAPYLLTIVLIVAHHAITGGTDLLVVGGYTLATWLTERLSNEVAARTRATNARIETRFAELAHDQINRVCDWLDRQAPPENVLVRLAKAADEMNEAVGL